MPKWKSFNSREHTVDIDGLVKTTDKLTDAYVHCMVTINDPHDPRLSLSLDGQHEPYFLIFTQLSYAILFNGNNNTHLSAGGINYVWRWINGKEKDPPRVTLPYSLGPGDKRIIIEAARLYMNEIYSEPNKVRQNPWLTSLSSVVAQ